MQATRVIKEEVLIPQPYLCERCGRYLVGYMDVANDQFVGFYNFQKTPLGQDPDPALAPFRSTVKLEQWQTRHPMRYDRKKDMDVPAGAPVVEKIVVERDEENVCAECMHSDPEFAKFVGLEQKHQMAAAPMRLAVIPARKQRRTSVL